MEKKKTKKPKKSVVLDLDFADADVVSDVSAAADVVSYAGVVSDVSAAADVVSYAGVVAVVSAGADVAPDILAPDNPVPNNPVPNNLAPDNLAPDNLAPDNLAPELVEESKLCKQEKNHSKNLNILDTASLEFLTNPLYHKIKRGMQTVGGVSIEDLNFYRKRIVGLTKELTKLEPSPTKDVQAAFDTYVFSLVRYFKLQDTQEIVQTQVVGEEVHVTQAKNDSGADRDSGADQACGGAYHTAFDLNTLDTELMTLPPHANTLDNYILKTSPETTRVIPIKIDFDTQLHAPEFKIKGIKKKLAQEK